MECKYGKDYHCSTCEYGVADGYLYDCELRLEEQADYQEWLHEQQFIDKEN